MLISLNNPLLNISGQTRRVITPRVRFRANLATIDIHFSSLNRYYQHEQQWINYSYNGLPRHHDIRMILTEKKREKVICLTTHLHKNYDTHEAPSMPQEEWFAITEKLIRRRVVHVCIEARIGLPKKSPAGLVVLFYKGMCSFSKEIMILWKLSGSDQCIWCGIPSIGNLKHDSKIGRSVIATHKSCIVVFYTTKNFTVGHRLYLKSIIKNSFNFP